VNHAPGPLGALLFVGCAMRTESDGAHGAPYGSRK